MKKGGKCFMGKTVFTIVKVVVSVASIGLGLVQNKIANKELDDKIAVKVAEALAKQASKEEL